jgi:hypothetical protein
MGRGGNFFFWFDEMIGFGWEHTGRKQGTSI